MIRSSRYVKSKESIRPTIIFKESHPLSKMGMGGENKNTCV